MGGLREIQRERESESDSGVNRGSYGDGLGLVCLHLLLRVHTVQ